jgi:DNA-binding transcriptional MerR regulator
MSNPLEHLKGTQFRGVKGLADAAERILRTIGPSQEKATVAEFPNERTIRYYLNEGLLPAPYGKAGLSSVFGYEHVLTLLVIKKLQADGLPVSVIKTLITDKTTVELEKLFGEEIKVFSDPTELAEYRHETGHTDDADVMVLHDAAARDEYLQKQPEKNEARKYLESLLLNRQQPRPAAPPAPPPRTELSDEILLSAVSLPEAEDEPPAMAVRASAAPQSPDIESKNWNRFEIAPGLELHVREDFRRPGERRRLVNVIDGILRRILGK